MLEILKSWWAVLGAIVVAAIAAAKYIHLHLLKSPADCHDVADRIENWRIGEEYRKTLRSGLVSLTRLIGKNFGLHSFGICIAVAMLYTVGLFFLSWSFGGPSKIGTGEFLPAKWLWWQRILLMVSLAAALVGLCSWLIPKVKRRKEVFFLYGLAVAGFFAYEGEVWFALAVAVALAAQYVVEYKVGLTLVSAAVAAFVLTLSGKIDVEVSLKLELFFCFIPLINGLFDWLSLGISRWLLAAVAAENSKWLFNLVHIMLDIALAFVFLFGLSFTLPWTIELVGRGEADWRSFLEVARDDPFRKGQMITWMLLSTLLPTSLHMAAVFGVLILPSFPFRDRVVAMLGEDEPPQTDRLLAAIWVMSVFVVGGIILLGMAVGLYHFLNIVHLPIGEGLYECADWAGKWAESLRGH